MLLVSRSSARYHHGDLQNALEEAALELLETVPAGRISLREVARRAGVSHNAPYHHFGDRAALLKALGVRAMGDLIAAQEEALAAEEGVVARLTAMFGAYVEYACAHPQAFALIFDPEYCVPGSPSEEMAALISRNEELLASEVADLIRLPRFEGRDPEALAAGLWATVHGMSQLVVLGHLPRTASRHALTALLA